MELGNITALATGLPLDWIVLAALVVVLALDSLRAGIGRATSVAVALPLAYVFFSLADASFLNWAQALFTTPFMRGAVFAVLFVGIYVLVRRMGLDYVDSGMGEPVQAILAGTATAVVFTCVWLMEPALSGLYQVSPQIMTAFAEQFRFWWLLGAYAALAFARG